MTLTRRRLLTISAAFACAPHLARADTWQGRAFGGDVSLTLHGPREITAPAISDARATMRGIEMLFSLYDPASALSELNASGQLKAPSPDFLALMHASDAARRATDGLFDPTIQPLWRAFATGGDVRAARAAIGWSRVRFDAHRITLAPGQALTFNGIAQGFATDRVTDTLRAMGLTRVLVNIGEHRALGGPYRLALHDPGAGHLGTRTLSDGAIATSSPGALSLGTGAHILHPTQRPRWSTVSVEAADATTADAFSTALVFASRDQIARIKDRAPALQRITLVDAAGDLTTI